MPLTERDAYTSLARAIVATAISDAACIDRRDSVMSFIESRWCETLCDWLGLDTETLREGIRSRLGIGVLGPEGMTEQFVAFVGEEFFEGMLCRSANDALDSYLRKRGMRWPERKKRTRYILIALGSGWRIEWEKGAPNYGRYMRKKEETVNG